MFRLLESNFRTPGQFSLRSRQKFGDPNEKSMNKHAALEPGYSYYILLLLTNSPLLIQLLNVYRTWTL